MMSLSRTDYQICIMIGKDWGGKSHKPETEKLTVASGWAQVCDEVLGTPCNFRVLEIVGMWKEGETNTSNNTFQCIKRIIYIM